MTAITGWGSDLKKCLRDILERCRGSVEPEKAEKEEGRLFSLVRLTLKGASSAKT